MKQTGQLNYPSKTLKGPLKKYFSIPSPNIIQRNKILMSPFHRKMYEIYITRSIQI